MIIAGFENTASVIRTTFLYLMTNPRVYQKFKEVIKEIVRDGKASSPITYEEAKKIPYLQVGSYPMDIMHRIFVQVWNMLTKPRHRRSSMRV